MTTTLDQGGIFRRAFWKATGERMIRGAVIGTVLFLVASGVNIVASPALNVFDIEWLGLLGHALGGGFVSLLLSLGGNAVSGNGPAFNATEAVYPNQPESPVNPDRPTPARQADLTRPVTGRDFLAGGSTALPPREGEPL